MHHLTVSLAATGFHGQGWRLCEGEALPVGRRIQDMARLAERAWFDAVWLGHEGPVRIDPLPLLGSLVAVTQRIGLGAHWTVDHAEPFHVARVLATLDHLAHGRTAWWCGLGDDGRPPAGFGHATPRDAAGAQARTAEFIDVVRKLWDSWRTKVSCSTWRPAGSPTRSGCIRSITPASTSRCPGR